MNSDKELNCEGLLCPMPILKAKKALTGLTKGQVLSIIATDPGTPADFQAFCKQTGHRLLQMTENSGTFRFWIDHQ